MAMIRTFIGISLSNEYKRRLGELAHEWQDRVHSRLAWTKPENWHLTLKFLGELPEEEVTALGIALGRIRFESFPLQAGGAGVFPPLKQGNPRVVWVGLTRGGKECCALAEAIEKTVTTLGYPPEKKPFAAHLTLARVKKVENDPWPEVLQSMGEVVWPEHMVDKFVLWRSELGAEGPVYTPLTEVKGT